MMQEIIKDVLILGSGGAGLLATLTCADGDPNLSIATVTKGLTGKSGCTRMVQGGMNAVLNPNDSIDRHFMDTLKGGKFLNNQELAWSLASNAPRVIKYMETKYGCFFDRDAEGNIHQKPFGGQSFDRTVHRSDLTGIEIVSRLTDQVFKRENVQLFEEHRAIDLLWDANQERVAGAVLLNIRTGEFLVIRSRAIILATGGGARMYKISAPSMEKSGDGVAAAYRFGATLMDLEMLQFHPTGLLAGNSRLSGNVLEEGLRGAGGRLYNSKGERFMGKYDSERLERSTRDVVSRGNYMEIQAGRGTANGGILLDMTHLGAEFVEKQFPGMVDRVWDIGKDLAREPIEISPTAHFHMGGIQIDTSGKSSIKGLFAAGEDSAGVHGANRLGGNGVGESTVFGVLVGEGVLDFLKDTKEAPKVSQGAVTDIINKTEKPLRQERSSEEPFTLRKELELMMWDKVGVVRNEKDLMSALVDIENYTERLEKISISGSKAFNMAWNEVINLRNILTIAKLVTTGAIERKESRGSHYRADFTETKNDEWLKNICYRLEGENLKKWTEDVKFTRIKKEDIK